MNEENNDKIIFTSLNEFISSTVIVVLTICANNLININQPSQYLPAVIKYTLAIHSLNIIVSIIRLFEIISKNIVIKNLSTALSFTVNYFNIVYSIVLCYFTKIYADEINIIKDNHPCIFIYILLIVCINIAILAKYIIIFSSLVISIPIFVRYLLENPKLFFSKHGIPEEILNNIDLSIADKDKAGHECIICTEEICSDDLIIKLKCKHYFHNKCIKEWFRSKYSCPICRSIDLF